MIVKKENNSANFRCETKLTAISEIALNGNAIKSYITNQGYAR